MPPCGKLQGSLLSVPCPPAEYAIVLMKPNGDIVFQPIADFIDCIKQGLSPSTSPSGGNITEVSFTAIDATIHPDYQLWSAGDLKEIHIGNATGIIMGNVQFQRIAETTSDTLPVGISGFSLAVVTKSGNTCILNNVSGAARFALVEITNSAILMYATALSTAITGDILSFDFTITFQTS